jgi:hypothetical protein
MSEAMGAISGAPDAMMSYQVEGPQLVDPKAQIMPVMDEAVAFATADNTATPKLVNFTKATNDDFEGKTSVAKGSGHLYVDADAATKALFAGVGDQVWR